MVYNGFHCSICTDEVSGKNVKGRESGNNLYEFVLLDETKGTANT